MHGKCVDRLEIYVHVRNQMSGLTQRTLRAGYLDIRSRLQNRNQRKNQKLSAVYFRRRRLFKEPPAYTSAHCPGFLVPFSG